MKKQIVCLVASLWFLLGAGSASAAEGLGRSEVLARFCTQHPANPACRHRARAVPEIDGAAGTQAIALVLGFSLLGAECLRRRRQRAS